MHSSGKILHLVNNNNMSKFTSPEEYFWNYLLSNNINNVFGLTGGGIIPLLNKIPQSMNWINIGNEEQNGFLAQIYGLYKKEVGILMNTYGPGICNSVNSIVNAVKENNPLLFITTYKPTAKINDFQNVDYNTILKGATNYYFQINNSGEFIKTLTKAYEIAKNKRTGVALMININIFATPIKIKHFSYNYLRENKLYYETRARQNITELCNNNKKTLIILGDGPFWNFTM